MCWDPAPPTEDILLASMSQVMSGEVDAILEKAGKHINCPISHVLDLLENPDSNNVIVGHNIPIKQEARMVIPPSVLSGRPLPVADECLVNVTPKYTIVDIHYDQGYSVLSAAIGSCAKVWLLWPPTKHNLRVYEAVAREIPLGQRLGLLLSAIKDGIQNGIVAYLGGTEALHIPAGWFHAMLTVTGGFLAGVTFSEAQSTKAVSACFSMDLRMAPGTLIQGGNAYVKCLECATSKSSTSKEIQMNVLEGWIEIQKPLQQAMDRRLKKHREFALEVLDC